MLNDELLAKIAESDAAKSLPPELKKNLDEFMAERKKMEESAQEIKEAADRASKKWEREELELREKLLRPEPWVPKVPVLRRFALCARPAGKDRFPYEPERTEIYCAVDLVTGFMSPYWGYYGYDDYLTPFFTQRIHPLLKARDENELYSHIKADWNFFHIDERSLGNDLKFSVLQYKFDEKTKHVEILGRSKPMTWKNHRESLKKEFDE